MQDMTQPAAAASSYRVGGFGFRLTLPAGVDAGRLLPPFAPFAADSAGADPLFAFAVSGGADAPRFDAAPLLEEQHNDLGLTRLHALDGGRYGVVLSAPGGSAAHVLVASPGFASCRAWVDFRDPQAGAALGSLVRVAFAQSVLPRGGVSVHASCVVLGGRAYLFMGPSGTGKSTHSRLWLRAFPGAWLLNDDNPVVRVEDGRAEAYGSPWSGKTACYEAASAPVGGMVRLSQGAANRFRSCRGVEAFAALLPGCSFIRQDATLREGLYDTLARLAARVAVGRLACLPDEAAARLCRAALDEEVKNNQTEKDI